jgi:hypothetical protein
VAGLDINQLSGDNGASPSPSSTILGMLPLFDFDLPPITTKFVLIFFTAPLLLRQIAAVIMYVWRHWSTLGTLSSMMDRLARLPSRVRRAEGFDRENGCVSHTGSRMFMEEFSAACDEYVPFLPPAHPSPNADTPRRCSSSVSSLESQSRSTWFLWWRSATFRNEPAEACKTVRNLEDEVDVSLLSECNCRISQNAGSDRRNSLLDRKEEGDEVGQANGYWKRRVYHWVTAHVECPLPC